MQLIWYNSIEREYQCGNSQKYKSLKSNCNNADAYTILMEFTGEDQDMAKKVLDELNAASAEIHLVQ